MNEEEEESETERPVQLRRILKVREKDIRSWLGETHQDEPSTSYVNRDALVSLLHKILSCYTHRSNHLIFPAVYQHLRFMMSICGIPHKSLYSVSYDSRIDPRHETFQFDTRKSISYFFHLLSRFESALRIEMHRCSLIRSSLLSDDCHTSEAMPFSHIYARITDAIRDTNRPALLHLIGNLMMVRHVVTTNFETYHDRRNGPLHYFTEMRIRPVVTPHLYMILLQLTIENSKTNPDFEDRLVQITKSFIAMLSLVRTMHANPIMSYLTEFLNVATVQSCSSSTFARIFQVEHNLARNARNFDFLMYWKYYRLLAEFVLAERQGSSFVGAAYMADQLAESSEKLAGSSVVFIETAMRIKRKARCSDGEILELATEAVRGTPNLIGRLSCVLQSLDFDSDDVGDLIEEATSRGLHPNDQAWLHYCEARIQSPGKFGIQSEVIVSCLPHLFAYLDYGKNRTSSKAWNLLWSCIQMCPASAVRPHWSSRSDWWPSFHSHSLPSDHADQWRLQVLHALINELSD